MLANTLLFALASTGTDPVALPSPVRAEGELAIRAAVVHVGDGKRIADGTVLVRAGRIAAVGAGIAVPDGAAVIEHDGHLSAGLIAMRDYSGSAGEGADSTRPVLPAAELAYAYDPEHPDFERLARAGITSVVIAPPFSAPPVQMPELPEGFFFPGFSFETPSAPLVGGSTALVKVGSGRLVQRRAQLHLSFSESALGQDAAPTSYPGALALLDELFANPSGALADAKSGRLAVVLYAGSNQEVQRAVAFAQRHGLKGAIAGAPRAGELAKAIQAAGLGVICAPFSPGIETRALRAVAELAEAGVPFGFALDAPERDPESLRLGAAACVREGLDPDVAWAALTSSAASLLGAAAEIGSVAAGRQADLVLWSGPPLDLGSTPVAVYVDGQKIHGGAQ